MSPAVVCAALALLVAQGAQASGWKLVWSDEFEGSGLVDPARWGYEEGFVRNNEKQYYTAGRRENVRRENGRLIIEARRENFASPKAPANRAAFTSGSITTQGKRSWTYGRFEVRAKLPTGRGTWPAIWMLGDNINTAGWPLSGEIDIMENVGFDPDVIHANIHTQAYNHVQKTNKGDRITVPKPYDAFHVYAAEWTPEKVEILVDGKRYFSFANEHRTIAEWPFDQPFYLILNVAVGGDWGGRNGIDESIFPQRMEVDYVRVYQQQ